MAEALALFGDVVTAIAKCGACVLLPATGIATGTRARELRDAVRSSASAVATSTCAVAAVTACESSASTPATSCVAPGVEGFGDDGPLKIVTTETVMQFYLAALAKVRAAKTAIGRDKIERVFGGTAALASEHAPT